MARPIEIDRDRAFAAAAELFWRKGYGATSLQDLLNETGMGRGSFYAAFQSKEKLFLAVMESYRARSAATLARVCSEQDGLQAIRGFIERTLIDIPDRARSKGCLLVNTVLELEGVESRLHGQAARSLNALNRTLVACLEEARRTGALRAGLEPESVGRLLTTLLEGWRVDSRKGASRRDLESQVALFFDLVATPGTSRQRAG